MTIIDAPNHFQVVPAPVGVPYRYGLASVIDYVPSSDVHALGGITWESFSCQPVNQTQNDCIDPGIGVLAQAALCSIGIASPFTVYVNYGESGAGMSSQQARDEARDLLLNGEQRAVELAVSTKMLADATTDPIGWATQSFIDRTIGALGFVEQEIQARTNMEPVIHMNRMTASLLGTVLLREGNTLRTINGTRVAAYGGWVGFVPGSVPPGATIFGTGPMVGIRGQVDYADGFNRATNDYSIIASRTYVIGYDCDAVAATVAFT